MDSSTQHKEAMGEAEATDLPRQSSNLAIASEAQTQSVVPMGSIDVQQMTPSASITPTIQQPNSGKEVLFLAIDQKQKQVQFSEVQLEHKLDETSESVGVKVHRSSAEEKTTTIIGAQVTEEGEVQISAWVVRRVAVFHEQLSVEVNKFYIVSPDGAVAEDIDGPQYEPSKTEKFCDCLCQAYTCSNLTGFARRGGKSPSFSKVENFATENLRKARALGMRAVSGTLMNPYTATCVGAVFRDFSVFAMFLFSLILWINVLVGFIHDQVADDDKEDDTYRLAKLIISTIGMIFSLIDLVHQTCTHNFTSCGKCSKCVTEAEKPITSNSKMNEPSSSTTDGAEDVNFKMYRYCNCPDSCVVVFDGARLVLLEMMNYPNLLLSIFQLLVQIVEKDGKAEVTTYISVLLSLLIALFQVYLARWFVLAGSIFSIQKVRTGDEEITVNSLAKTNSARFHVVFVLNAIGHTIVQMVMIVAIGARFYHEYQNASGSNYLPSAQLWFMIVFGYVGPFIGVIMFLITCHYWTQQFPIQLCLDMLKLLHKPGIGEILRSWKKGNESSNTMKKIHHYLDEENLLEDFKKVRNEKLERKLAYPFASPVHVILCLLYSGLLLAFGLCAVVNGPVSGGWVFFYLSATIFAIFVNGYACAVAIAWISIFALVLMTIALIILGCLLLCMLSSCSPEPRKNNY